MARWKPNLSGGRKIIEFVSLKRFGAAATIHVVAIRRNLLNLRRRRVPLVESVSVATNTGTGKLERLKSIHHWKTGLFQLFFKRVIQLRNVDVAVDYLGFFVQQDHRR